MADRNEHLVVIMLDHMPKAEEFEIWERHITIVPWFPVDDAERLDEVLRGVAQRHKRFSVKAGPVEEWGRRKEKYDVQKIDNDWRLQSLHQDVFNSLEKSGFPIHQKDFMGDKYDPHIALRNRLQKGNAMPEGQEIKIGGFTLVSQIRVKGSGRMIKSLVKDYELVAA
jgi:2'-5' RNA ligase